MKKSNHHKQQTVEVSASAPLAGKKRARAAASGGIDGGRPPSDFSGLSVLAVQLHSGESVRVLAKHVEDSGARAAPGSKSKYLLALFDPGVEVDDVEVALGSAADGDASTQSRGMLSGTEGGPADTPLAFAYFSFDSAKAVKKVLALPPCAAAGPGGGLRGWLAALDSQKFDSRVLQAAVDAETAEFDKKQSEVSAWYAVMKQLWWDGGRAVVPRTFVFHALSSFSIPNFHPFLQAAAARAELAAAESADGFTLVSKGRRHRVEEAAVVEAGGVGTGGMATWESDNQKRKKKRGSLIMSDFYAFQKAEAKIDRLSELRKRFEEDKARIAKLRSTRTFKPY